VDDDDGRILIYERNLAGTTEGFTRGYKRAMSMFQSVPPRPKDLGRTYRHLKKECRKARRKENGSLAHQRLEGKRAATFVWWLSTRFRSMEDHRVQAEIERLEAMKFHGIILDIARWSLDQPRYVHTPLAQRPRTRVAQSPPPPGPSTSSRPKPTKRSVRSKHTSRKSGTRG